MLRTSFESIISFIVMTPLKISVIATGRVSTEAVLVGVSTSEAVIAAKVISLKAVVPSALERTCRDSQPRTLLISGEI